MLTDFDLLSFLQFKRFIELRSFVSEWSPRINGSKENVPSLSGDDWEICQNIIEALEKAADITQSMQKEQYVPSDCYIDWEELKLHLNGLSHNPLAEAVHANMVKRKREIWTHRTCWPAYSLTLASVFY